MDFILGALFVLAMLGAAAFGSYLGLQISVDRTKRNGHFEAYGTKWRAVPAEDA